MYLRITAIIKSGYIDIDMAALTRFIAFGPYQLPMGQVFFESALTFGIVNLKPIVPGHVLFVPKRVVPRLHDLTPEEVSDLFSCVHKFTPVLERHFSSLSSNIAIQDGLYAGQSVPHVHVHILPRKPDDFENNDDIYAHLEQQNLHQSLKIPEDRRPRTMEEMEAEAAALRCLLPEFAPSL